MIATILSFFTGSLGKLVGIGLGVTAVVGLIWFAIAQHDAKVTAQALAQYNQTQLEQSIADNQAFQITLTEIQENQEKLQAELNKKISEINDQASKIREDLAKIPDANKESSEVLKEAVKQIQTIGKKK